MNTKIIILDYHSREVFVIEDSTTFYNVNGDFELGLALEYLSREHGIDLEEEDVHFMMTNSLIINIL